VGLRVCRRRWRLGLPLEGPPGLCPAGLRRIPGPGPAAGAPPPAAPRFVYGAPEACPPNPHPCLRDPVAFANLPPAAEGSLGAVGGLLAPGEREVPPNPPPQLSMAVWLQHS
jgi:hypothetical protein